MHIFFTDSRVLLFYVLVALFDCQKYFYCNSLIITKAAKLVYWKSLIKWLVPKCFAANKIIKTQFRLQLKKQYVRKMIVAYMYPIYNVFVFLFSLLFSVIFKFKIMREGASLACPIHRIGNHIALTRQLHGTTLLSQVLSHHNVWSYNDSNMVYQISQTPIKFSNTEL